MNGVRQDSPYIWFTQGKFVCKPCDVILKNPDHLKKKTHLNKVWFWCYGCDEDGFRQRPKCPGADFDSRDINNKYWSDIPGSEGQDQGQQHGGGQAWATAAASATGGGTASVPGRGGTVAASASARDGDGPAGPMYVSAHLADGNSDDDDERPAHLQDLIESINDLQQGIDNHVQETKKSLEVLVERGRSEQVEKMQTLEFRKLLADTLDEHHKDMQTVKETVQELMNIQKSLQARMGLGLSASTGSLPVLSPAQHWLTPSEGGAQQQI